MVSPAGGAGGPGWVLGGVGRGGVAVRDGCWPVTGISPARMLPACSVPPVPGLAARVIRGDWVGGGWPGLFMAAAVRSGRAMGAARPGRAGGITGPWSGDIPQGAWRGPGVCEDRAFPGGAGGWGRRAPA